MADATQPTLHRNNPHTKQPHLTRRRLLNLGVLLVLLYVLAPQIGSFHRSFAIIGRADFWYFLFGLLTTIATYVFAAGQYKLLAQKPLRYVRTLLVQGASAFTNRLLPAGIGGISLNVAYLRRERHTLAQAGVVVAVNNGLGFVGHALLLSVLVVFGTSLTLHTGFRFSGLVYGIAALIFVVGVAVLLVKRVRSSIGRFAKFVVHDVVQYRKHPLKLISALACALCLTLLYAVTLYLCMRSVGYMLSLGKVFVIFTAGVGAATVTPTPGGLVGAEAALAAGFVAYGLPAADGVAIALVYRLLTYWLPLITGFGLFEFVERKHYI